MKIPFYIKDPDGAQDLINTRPKAEREAFSEKYFEFGEYFTLVFDTKTMTAVLKEIK